MCYTRSDRDLEEEARRLRAEDEDRRRKAEATTTEELRKAKPLTEKAKEMVGAK